MDARQRLQTRPGPVALLRSGTGPEVSGLRLLFDTEPGLNIVSGGHAWEATRTVSRCPPSALSASSKDPKGGGYGVAAARDS